MRKKGRNRGLVETFKRWKIYAVACVHCCVAFAFFLLLKDKKERPSYPLETHSQVAALDLEQRQPRYTAIQAPAQQPAPITAAPLPVQPEPQVFLLPNGGIIVMPNPQPVAATVAAAPESTPEEAKFGEKPVEPPKPGIGIPQPKRLALYHNSGWGQDGGIGFGTDVTTFDMFLAPNYRLGHFYPFVDLKGHRFDNDTYAADIGVGGRYIPDPNGQSKFFFCEMLGFNVYYDWRQGFLESYNQVGIGLEVLGRWWDFRANGYLPIGRKTYQLTCEYDYEGGYYIINKNLEITTYGFNAEIGWLAVDYGGFLFYVAAGPYYLTRKCNCFNFDPILGGEVRIRPQWRDYFAVDLRFSYDSNFYSVFETTFIVSLPLYQIKGQNERPCRLTDRQIYQPIERLDIMTLGRRSCWCYNY